MAADDLLSDLTDAQRAAVTHGEGPLLILAAAGSGKTRVITRRVAYLLQQGVRPGNVLAITFTNKAAGEMRERVEKLVPGNRVWVSTFHSLGARLLRMYADRLGLDKTFTIYDVDDRNRLVKAALESTGIDNVKFTPERLAGAISKAKNQLLSPSKYAEQAFDFFSQTTAKVYHAYEKKLRAANAMDFDDLLYIPAMALKTNEELRAELDARFQYVLVDEYQDTNAAQYAIANRLCLNYRNICTVGDPDQCVVPGTLIATADGPRPVESIRPGDRVLSGIGWGKTAPRRVDQVMVNPHSGKVIVVEVEEGIIVRMTPNHVCFADFRPTPDNRFVCPNGKKSKRLMAEKDFLCVQARYLHPGLSVPIASDGQIHEREILAIRTEEYEGQVYDLSVPDTHNFVANGLVVHNSIYKWRGSDIKNILDFERDYPDAKVIALEKNYRSTSSILAAAGMVIEHNKKRKKKALVTDNPAGEPVRVLTFDTGLDEADGIVLRIKDAVARKAYRYRDAAVFVRVNALTRALESAFVKHGVPFQIVKGLAFFDRKENRDVLAYLRLLVNPQDPISFIRAVNEPTRGVGKTSLEKLQAYAESKEITLFSAAGEVAKIPEIKSKAAAGLKDFYKLMTGLRAKLEHPPHDVIRMVLDESGYKESLQASQEDDDIDRLANVEEMVTAARQFHAEDESRTLGDFLEQITLASDVDSWDDQQDRVSVMTLHAAKGLEFPVVFLMAVEQGLLPHERSLQNDDDLEEERRLCFVGMTRAMRELYLTHARLREFRGQALYAVSSMFLEELPKDVEHEDRAAGRNAARNAFDEWRSGGGPAAARGWADTGLKSVPLPPIKPPPSNGEGSGLDIGQVVEHAEYGIGKVTDVSGVGVLKRVKIRFASAGEKTFVADKVKVRVVRRSG